MSLIVLAISGGIDSSVAAWLLREAGHEVTGLFLQHGHVSSRATADAQRAAERLDMPLHTVDVREEFDRRVVGYFVDEYTAARAPNPCVVCNRWIKFAKVFEYAEQTGAEFVATGHYARLVAADNGEIALCRGLDDSKDQSYVLFDIARGLLPRIKFPVGKYHKEEIRQLAARLRLSTTEGRDSQDVCFVPDGDHARFVRERCGKVDTAGEIVTTDGVVVGRHDGIERFTVGQRHGLRVALGEPRYVVRLEPKTRRVVIGLKEELARTELTAAGANWLIDVPCEPVRCRVKIRYRSRPADATVRVIDKDCFHVQFDEPCHGIAPGQAAVCYDGERVLGGGYIV